MRLYKTIDHQEIYRKSIENVDWNIGNIRELKVDRESKYSRDYDRVERFDVIACVRKHVAFNKKIYRFPPFFLCHFPPSHLI